MNKKKLFKVLSIFLLALWIPNIGFLQEEEVLQEENEQEEINLDEIDVTEEEDNFTEEETDEENDKIDEVLVEDKRLKNPEKDVRTATQALQIITREEIEKSGARNVGDLLSKQAGGIYATHSDGQRSTRATLRGLEGHNTLVLIDGMSVTSTRTQKSRELFNIPVNSIERIEITRGNESFKHGNGAFGGVINIVTKKELGTHLLSHVKSGSNKLLDLGLGVLSGNKNTSVFFYNTYNAAQPEVKKEGGKNSFYTDKIYSGLLSVTHKPTELSRLSLNANFTSVQESTSYYSTRSKKYSDSNYERQNSSIGSEYQILLSDFYEPFIKAKYQTQTAGAGTFYNYTRLYDMGISNRFHFLDSQNILSLDFDYRQHAWIRKKNFDRRRNTYLVTLGNQFLVIDRLNLQAAVQLSMLRSNHGIDETGVNYKVGASYRIIDNPNATFSLFKLRANSTIGESHTEEYIAFVHIDPDAGDLKGEKGFSIDGGFDLSLFGEDFYLSGTYFYYNIRDKVLFETYLTKAKRIYRRPVNVDKAKSNGFEIDTRLKLPVGFGLNASYMYRDTKIEAKQDKNSVPLRDPKNHVKVGLLWNYWNPLSIGVNWRLVTDGEYWYYRNAPENWSKKGVKVKGYNIFDVNLSLKLIKELRLHGGINNLFNEKYKVDSKSNYGPERNFFVGLNFQLDL